MGNTDSMQREHSAESIAVGEWAANLILKNVFDSIDEKEKFGKDMRFDTSTEGPEPEPPVDEDCPKTGRPTVAGRPIPSPLQDDPTWAGHKEEEGAKSAAPPVLVTPAEQSPEAGAPQCWPQTPQSPVTQAPMDPAAFYGAWGYGGAVAPPAAPFGAFPPGANSFGNSFNAGFNAGFAGVFNGGFGGAGAAPPAHPNVLGNAAVQGWGGGGCNNACGGVACGPNNVPGYNPYAPFGSYAWHQYGGYGGFPPAPAPQGPNPNQDMRQAYYPQANSQAQWTQGGQAFFQPFSTQPPVHPAMQQYAPPPAAPQYPPQQPQQRAPLQAQFSNAPLLNTQPFQQQQPPPTAYPQMPAMRPPAAPTAAPPTVAPSVAPTVPPAAVQPVQPLAPSQPAPSAPPVIPTVQAARAAKPPSPVHTKEERRQAAEEVLAQQRAWVAMLSRARDESAENRPSEASTAVTTPAAAAVATSASASTAELKPNEATSSAQPASPTPSTEENQAKSSSKASTWAPKIAPRKGSGKGGVWVAKDSSKGGGKSAAKGNGKGKGKGLVYRPKHEVSEETNERRQKKRGKMNELLKRMAFSVWTPSLATKNIDYEATT